jgi:hypothetical protein
MTSPEGLMRATGRLLVLLALVAIPAAIYAFVVVRGQVASATAENLRAVGEIGAQLDDRLDALRQVTVTFLGRPRKPLPTEPCASASCILTADAGADVIAQLRTNDWLRNAEPRAVLPASVGCAPANAERATSMEAVKAGDLTVTVADGRNPAISVTACKLAADTVPALQVPLGDLIPRRPFDSKFDGVIIANCRGQVLYSDSRRELAVSDIAELVVDAVPAEGDKNSESGAKRQSLCAGRSQSWVVEPREVAGIPIRAFGHPYWPSNLAVKAERATGGSVPADEATMRDMATWYLVGLESEASFRQRTRTLPFEAVVAISPLIVLALLAWPFLVIVLSSPGTRFGPSLPISFAASMLGGAGLLAVIAVALIGHYETSALRDHLLARVANELSNSFEAELERSVNVLGPRPVETKNPLLNAENISRAIAACGAWNVEADGDQKGRLPRCFAQFAPNAAGALLEAADVFETAFQLDANGGRVGPDLSLRDAGSSRRSLSDRGYFLRASKGLLWELPRSGRRFVIEQIRSKDFGWALSSIAVPAFDAGATAPADAKPPAVLVLNKRLQTFFQPILPLGVGFAVVRDTDGSATLDGTAWRTGDVLFHSEDSRSLIENILSETDGDRGLGLTLSARRATLLSVSYHGSPYRFYTKPLRALPWTLIVTYDKTILRTFTWRTLLGAGTAFVSYLLIISIAAWALERRVFRRAVPAWLWPSNDNRLRHRTLIVPLFGIAALLLAAGLRWIEPGSPPGALWSVLLGTFFALYGALSSHFAGGAPPRTATDGTGRGARVLRRIGDLSRRNVLGTALLVIGVAAVAAPMLVAKNFEVLSALLPLSLLGLLAVPPVPRSSRLDSDRPFVWFLLAVLAAVAVVPGILLTSDTFGFHRGAYEKANLAHVARAASRRDDALLGEARRLQATTFDRASILAPDRPGSPAPDVPETLRNRGLMATGTQLVRGAIDDVARSDTLAAEQSRFRTATSWFATEMPADSAHALLFADGWRLQTDGDSTYWWTDEGSGVLHVSVPRSGARRYEFIAVEGGLFNPPAAQAEPVRVAVWTMTGVGTLAGVFVVLFLAVRALRTVAVSFFGPRDLRDAGPTPADARRARWQECSPEDTLLLRHLASGGLVSCVSNEAAVRRLVAQGLVEFGSGLRLSPPAIADEIRLTPRSDSEREFEKSRAVGPWAGIRVPFYTLLGFAVIALIVAAPNALSSTMTVLAASAGGVGVIIQIMSLMLRGK